MENIDTLNDKRDEATEAREQFIINDESRANWYLSKLATIESEKARVKAQAAQRIAELDADAERLRFRHEADLQAWAQGEATRRNRKSITLLQGTLAFRTVPAALRVIDEGTAFQFADSEAPHLLKVKRDVDTTAFIEAAQKYLEETGDLLPGVERTLPRESFSVKFPGAGKGKAGDTE